MYIQHKFQKVIARLGFVVSWASTWCDMSLTRWTQESQKAIQDPSSKYLTAKTWLEEINLTTAELTVKILNLCMVIK